MYLPSATTIRVAIAWVAPSAAAIGRDDLLAGGRHHHDVTAAQFVVGDQVGGLREDQRIDDLVQGLTDHRTHLFDVPAGAHVRQVGAHPIHLIVIGPGHEEQELGVGRFEYGAAVQESLIEKRFAERQGARLCDDRLVEVEKCGGADRLTGCAVGSGAPDSSAGPRVPSRHPA